MIDLHLHSTFSDGLCTPEEIVSLGVLSGLQAMCLTDHDTLAGVPRFLAAAQEQGLRAVSGLELSVEVPGKTVHILGYGCRVDDPAFLAILEQIREGRHRRNVEIIARLMRAGCCITWNDVLACAGEGEVVGRPHFAKALVNRGYARSWRDAFKRYLGRGAVAYVERFRLTPEAAVAAIHAAGGVAVFAHPYRSQLDETELNALMTRLIEAGLDGLEVYYDGFTRREIDRLLKWVEQADLIATGGTDFHGCSLTMHAQKVGRGSPQVPDWIFDALVARIEKRASECPGVSIG